MATWGSFTTFRNLVFSTVLAIEELASWKKEKEREPTRATQCEWSPAPRHQVASVGWHCQDMLDLWVRKLDFMTYDTWGHNKVEKLELRCQNKARASEGLYILYEDFLEQFHLPKKWQQELVLSGHAPSHTKSSLTTSWSPFSPPLWPG